MYCKHHRFQSWHNNASPSYRSSNHPQPFDPFTIDQAYITADNFRQSRASQRHPNSHPILINSNNRLNSLDDQSHAMICDVNDTTAFIDSMTSIVRRNNNNNNHTFGEDLCIDLPSTHPSSTGTHLSSSPNFSGVNSCYTGSHRGDNIRSVVDFHTVVDGDPSSGLPGDVDDDDGDDDGDGDRDGEDEDDDEAAAAANVDHHQIITDVSGHPVYGYYMIGYSNETNGHSSSRVPLTPTTASVLNDRRMPTGSLRANMHHSRTLNHRMVTQQQHQHQHSNGESIMTTATTTNGGLPSGYTISNRGVVGAGNLNLRHPNMNILPGTIMNPDDNCCLSPSESTQMNDMNAIGSSAVTNSNVVMPNSVPAYIPGPDEFYTINDSDDLEINWPQETVAGVNG
ncbi:unnamed protein product [Trichobilharzia regenti]|nr:unnamed protein product [Trichobilharzia regenti]